MRLFEPDLRLEEKDAEVEQLLKDSQRFLGGSDA